MKCAGIIDLGAPVGVERKRAFAGYYTRFRYRCPSCNALHAIRATSFRDGVAVPALGTRVCDSPIPTPLPAPWEFGLAGVDFYRAMESIEDRFIAQALRLSGGNKKEAAKLLRVKRTTLQEKLKRQARRTEVAA